MKGFLLGFALTLCSVLALCFFTDRTQFEFQLLFWSIGYIGYFLICFTKAEKNILPKLVAMAVFIRLIACFSFPALSDDIYRFVWDGELNLKGISVYEFKPSQIQDSTLQDQQVLFKNLNSKNYFSVYPPVSQMVFAIGAYIGKGIYWKTVFIKLILLFGEIGIIVLIGQMLKVHNKSKQKILFYAYNPLVIIEICGNAHFEGLALLALLTTAHLIYRNKIWLTGFTFASAVLIKLNPLIYLPVLMLQFKKRVHALILLSGSLSTALLFIYKTEHINNIAESVSYYFVRFEFNSGVYYIFRSLGYYIYGYNIISFLGPSFSILCALIILYLSFVYFKKKNIALIEVLFYICLVYLIFSPVLHPWYLIPLIGLSLFTNWRFPLVWSFLIFISYHVYAEKPYLENMFLVYLEYVFLIIYVLIEVAVPKWQKV